jgi:hypothetical protein
MENSERVSIANILMLIQCDAVRFFLETVVEVGKTGIYFVGEIAEIVLVIDFL